MNANEITFGIEFETTLPNTDSTPIGPYHGGWQVSWLPQGWKAERDSSIQTTPDRKGCEFVSPKLRGAEGIAEVERAIDAINEHERGKELEQQTLDIVNKNCDLEVENKELRAEVERLREQLAHQTKATTELVDKRFRLKRENANLTAKLAAAEREHTDFCCHVLDSLQGIKSSANIVGNEIVKLQSERDALAEQVRGLREAATGGIATAGNHKVNRNLLEKHDGSH